ncbi:MAG: hypothetical protein Fur0019_08180 [Tibeticola sp.]
MSMMNRLRTRRLGPLAVWAGVAALAGNAGGAVAQTVAAPAAGDAPPPRAVMQMAAPVQSAPVGAAPTAPGAATQNNAAAAAAAAANGANAVNPLTSLAGLGTDYTIGPNDLIDIDVYGVPELKRTVRVNSSGLVSLPLVGQVSLGGLTAQEAEKRLAAAYGEKYLQNPQISVFIREFTTQRVTVEGAVAKPGVYPFTGQLTLLRTMALVGGGGPMARLDEVMVYRKAPDGRMETLTYNMEKIRDGTEPDPIIYAEDVIVVKRDSTRALLRDSLLRDAIDAINPFSALAPK